MSQLTSDTTTTPVTTSGTTSETTSGTTSGTTYETTSYNLGMVKWFNGTKGYGFITNLETEQDIFVHHSNLIVNEDCWKTLLQGEYVEYDIDSGTNNREQAKHVTGIHKGPLMCESNRNNNLNIIRSRWKTKEGEDDTTTETH